MGEEKKPGKYRTTNWAALKARGSLTVWLDRGHVMAGHADRQTWPSAEVLGRGHQFCLSIKCLFNLPLRQSLGVVQSLLQLAQLEWVRVHGVVPHG